MFVGDRIDKDAKPAIKLGMKPILKSAYTNKNKKIPPEVLKIEKLSDLPELIKKINTK